MKVENMQAPFISKESLDNKIKEWKKQKEILKQSKEREMELRKYICEDVMGQQHGKCKSTYKDLKVKYNTSYKLDEDKWRAIVNEIKEENDIALKAVEYKPSLSNSILSKIPEDHIFWECIIENKSACTIEISSGDNKVIGSFGENGITFS